MHRGLEHGDDLHMPAVLRRVEQNGGPTGAGMDGGTRDEQGAQGTRESRRGKNAARS